MSARASAKRLLVTAALVGGLGVTTLPASATEYSCDTLTADEAQEFLDDNPWAEDHLDPDGDGIACNHDTEDDDQDSGRQTDDDITETIADEVADLNDDFIAFASILADLDDASRSERRDLMDEGVAIAEDWADYPDVAAEMDFPRGSEDLEEAYLDMADAIGTAGDDFLTWVDLDAEDDPDADAAFDDFFDSMADASSAILDVETALEDGDSGSNGKSRDDEEEDEDTDNGPSSGFAADVQDELDDVIGSFDRFEELLTDIVDAEDDEAQEIFTEIVDIAEGWADYPDVAEDVAAEAGRSDDDLVDAYLEFAGYVGEAGDAFDDYLNTPDADEAQIIWETTFSTAYSLVYSTADDVQDEIDLAEITSAPVATIHTASDGSWTSNDPFYSTASHTATDHALGDRSAGSFYTDWTTGKPR